MLDTVNTGTCSGNRPLMPTSLCLSVLQTLNHIKMISNLSSSEVSV